MELIQRLNTFTDPDLGSLKSSLVLTKTCIDFTSVHVLSSEITCDKNTNFCWILVMVIVEGPSNMTKFLCVYVVCEASEITCLCALFSTVEIFSH